MIVVFIGTRAQLIKMAPVMRALERQATPYRLVLTGQHRATMRELLDEFGVRAAAYELCVAREVTGMVQMLLWSGLVLWRALVTHRVWFVTQRQSPSAMVVHGDTVSTLLGACIGRCFGMRVVHVESGLTSGSWREPFPEELTRRAVFRLSHIAFCPGEWAVRNLARLNVQAIDTGRNTIVDAVDAARERFAELAPSAASRDYAVVSLHRFENIFDRARLEHIIALIERVAERILLVFVLHPATHKQLEKYALHARLAAHPRMRLTPRMTYVPFLKLLDGAAFAITDGGSNQEELTYMQVPTLLMRAATERQDGLEGNCVLANYDAATVEEFVSRALALPSVRAPLMPATSPSRVIASYLQQTFAVGG